MDRAVSSMTSGVSMSSIWRLFMLGLLILDQASLALTQASVSTASGDVDCTLDSDGSNPKLDKCLQKGERLINRYIRALVQGDDFSLCSGSDKFLNCIDPYMEKCHNVRYEIHSHWRKVIQGIKCACSDASAPECSSRPSLECLRQEYGSPFIARCDALHHFNREQRTQSDCHFLRENVNCKDVLIASKCDNTTAEFTYHVFRLYHDDMIRQENCHLPRTPTYKGFRYTDGSCDTFLEGIKSCAGQYISRQQMLTFRDDNDFIASASHTRADIRNACLRFESYETCVEDIRTGCPLGWEQLHDIDADLRNYEIKMTFICGERKKDYLKNYKCFNKFHEDNTIEMCNSIMWHDVSAIKENITSYHYYCQPERRQVQLLQQELNKIKLCYGEVAKRNCGDESTDILFDMINIIFDDPTYLRFRFRPDCELHAGPLALPTQLHELPMTSSPTTSATTIQQTKRPHRTRRPHSRRPPHDVSPTQTTSNVTSPDHHSNTLRKTTLYQKTSPTSKPTPVKPRQSPVSDSVRQRASVLLLLVTLLYARHCDVT